MAEVVIGACGGLDEEVAGGAGEFGEEEPRGGAGDEGGSAGGDGLDAGPSMTNDDQSLPWKLSLNTT